MVQLIQITEEKLTDNILTAIKQELEQLKKEFKTHHPPTWISLNKVAKMHVVSFPTLYSWHKKKVLIAHSIGNRVYYKLDDITNALTPKYCLYGEDEEQTYKALQVEVYHYEDDSNISLTEIIKGRQGVNFLEVINERPP